MARTKGSFVLADILQNHGISHVFYVEAILRETMIEFEKRGIRRIVAHSEKGAAYMADGFARAARRPAVCMAQSVGAANLASGLQDAYLAHSPVVAITGKKPPLFQHRNAYQEIDHTPLYDAVTKFNAAIEDPAQLPVLLRQAFREATTGSPRPVHLDVTNQLGQILENAEIDYEPAPASEARYARVPAFRPAPDEEDVRCALELLENASRPLMIAGGGAVASDAGCAIVAFAEKMRIPVATSTDGKGLIPENHPLAVGCVGGYGRNVACEIAGRADVVLFIACGTGDQVTNDWKLLKTGANGAKIIQIDIEPKELGRNYPNAASLLGDARASVERLIAKASPRGASAAWAGECEALVAAWRRDLRKAQEQEQTPMRAERLCAEVERALPKDVFLVSDTGFSPIWASSLIEFAHPEQRFVRAAGGSLGWGYPASLGVKFACPERPVVCFTGDGALWYHINEMETAVRHNVATVTVLNNNQGFGQCYRGIMATYGDRPGRPQEQYAFTPVDFSKLATDIGAFAVRVERPQDVAPAIERALAANRPALVEVLTDIRCDPQVY